MYVSGCVFRVYFRMFAAMQNNAWTDKNLLARYLALEQPEDACQVMYVWIDGTGEFLRAKTRTLRKVPEKPSGKKCPYMVKNE